MVNNSMENSLLEIKKFLVKKKKFEELSSIANVSLSTVYNTFRHKDVDDLVGDQITVFKCAITLVNEIKSLQELAELALNK